MKTIHISKFLMFSVCCIFYIITISSYKVYGDDSQCARYQVYLKSEDICSEKEDYRRSQIWHSVGRNNDYNGLWILDRDYTYISYKEVELPRKFQSCNQIMSTDYFRMKCESIGSEFYNLKDCTGHGYLYFIHDGLIFGPILSLHDVSRICHSLMPHSIQKEIHKRILNAFPDQTNLNKPIGIINGNRITVDVFDDQFHLEKLHGDIVCIEKINERKKKVLNTLSKLSKKLNDHYIGSKRIETIYIQNRPFKEEFEITGFLYKEIDTSIMPIKCLLGDNLFQIWMTEKVKGPYNYTKEKIIGYFDGEYFFEPSEFRNLYPWHLYTDPPTVEDEVEFAIDLALFAVDIGIAARAFNCLRTIQISTKIPNKLKNIQSTFDDLVEQFLLPKYREIDSNLRAGYTGSFRTGLVGNPKKIELGKKYINLDDFDIDYWIESDILFQKFGSSLKADVEFRKILSETNGFGGLRPNKKGFSIKFKPRCK